MVKLALTGDIMLGRLVNRSIVRNTALPPETVWGDVLPLLHAADLRIGNLECVISDRGSQWEPRHKIFHFRASPRAVDLLRVAQFDFLTLANNHVLDYGPEALVDCLRRLDEGEIAHAGAGSSLEEAGRPVRLTRHTQAVAVVALTDNEPAWEATPSQPGINYVACDERGLTPLYRERIGRSIESARRMAHFVIVSAHVGPNWGSPSVGMRRLAHQLLDFGANLYWGHSNHTPQGIEVVGRNVILYSAGDFIDDYAVDPVERNDLSFLFVLDIENEGVQGVSLYPVQIRECRVQRAFGNERRFLEQSMAVKCAAFGSDLVFQDGEGRLRL